MRDWYQGSTMDLRKGVRLVVSKAGSYEIILMLLLDCTTVPTYLSLYF